MLLEEKNNITEHLSKDKYKFVREKLISLILCTDMSNHFSDVAKLKGRLASNGIFLIFTYIFT